MIELLGLSLSYEAVIVLLVAFGVDELLPFLPTKANGIVHAVVLGLKKSQLFKGTKPKDDRIDEVLKLMRKWDERATEITEDDGRGR